MLYTWCDYVALSAVGPNYTWQLNSIDLQTKSKALQGFIPEGMALGPLGAQASFSTPLKYRSGHVETSTGNSEVQLNLKFCAVSGFAQYECNFTSHRRLRGIIFGAVSLKDKIYFL